MNFKAAITQVALAVAFSSAAQAAVIYDNGAPNQSNGNEATQWIQSEDFTFDGGHTHHRCAFLERGQRSSCGWHHFVVHLC